MSAPPSQPPGWTCARCHHTFEIAPAFELQHLFGTCGAACGLYSRLCAKCKHETIGAEALERVFEEDHQRQHKLRSQPVPFVFAVELAKLTYPRRMLLLLEQRLLEAQDADIPDAEVSQRAIARAAQRGQLPQLEAALRDALGTR